jgi:hypothetical protein
VKYLYDKHKDENISFQKLIEMACSQLVSDKQSNIRLICFSLSRKVHLRYFSKVFIIQANYVPHGLFDVFLSNFYSISSEYSSRGSPMVIGVKCVDQLIANHIPVMFSKGEYMSLFERHCQV